MYIFGGLAIEVSVQNEERNHKTSASGDKS